MKRGRMKCYTTRIKERAQRAGMTVKITMGVMGVVIFCALVGATMSVQPQPDPHWGALPGEAPHSHIDTTIFMWVVGGMGTAVAVLAGVCWTLIKTIINKADAEADTVREIAPLTAKLVEYLPRVEKAVDKLYEIVCYKRDREKRSE